MLAALHFCETTNACGKCTPCLWVKAQEHPDIFVLNSNHSPVKLDEVKEIVPHLNTHPSPGNTNQTHARKVVCIVDAENLTVQAMNFLLKTIEEPPPYAQIYLSTSKKQHLLTTLLSRCVQWPIQPPSKDAIMQLLKKQQIAALQNLGEAQLLDLIRRSGSTPGATLKGLEAMTGGELKEEKEVRKLLKVLQVVNPVAYLLATVQKKLLEDVLKNTMKKLRVRQVGVGYVWELQRQ